MGSTNSVLAARGSDEAIDVLSRIYLRAGADAILQCTPTFGMYQVAARIQGAEVIEIPLDRSRGWASMQSAYSTLGARTSNWSICVRRTTHIEPARHRGGGVPLHGARRQGRDRDR